MKSHVVVELIPFEVPDFVYIRMPVSTKKEGFKELPKFYLPQIDEVDLFKLCENFKDEVFKKAGKNLPPTAE